MDWEESHLWNLELVSIFFILFFLIGKSCAAKTLNIQIYACAKHIQQGRVLNQKLDLLCLLMSNVLIMIYAIDMILWMVWYDIMKYLE